MRTHFEGDRDESERIRLGYSDHRRERRRPPGCGCEGRVSVQEMGGEGAADP